MTWTEEQIIALSPDAPSAKSGKDLAKAAKWVTTGASHRALWGECQGSGALPYRTGIDLRNTAFKCTCPSRKFPCKHGLGLFLLYIQQPEALNRPQKQYGYRSGWISGETSTEEGRNKNRRNIRCQGTD
jgi:uncharacterized Zn finger protein